MEKQPPRVDRSTILSTIVKQITLAGLGNQLSIVAVIDLRQFQQINQLYGHLVGDTILAELYQRLSGLTKQPSFCGRIDGDKFALLISPLLDIQLLPLLAKTINALIAEPFPREKLNIQIRVSIGFTASNSNSLSAERLLLEAESAAKKAKQSGEDYHISKASSYDQSPTLVALEQDIDEALERNAFNLFYQPKLCLATQVPMAAEGLIRWDQAHDQNINSEQLISIIERSGRMSDLFRWTINTALRESASWPKAQGPITVAINISASCLKQPDLFPLIESSLNLWGGDPSVLCIEVTESAIQQDLAQGFQVLSKIKDLGVKISIDDFGTGYSSLEYFKYIPASELKIDKSFVLNMLDSPVDMQIVKLIIEWGRRFNLLTVAEGVENQQVLNILCELGCSFAQGYHISQALPQTTFMQWLTDYRREDYFENSLSH